MTKHPITSALRLAIPTFITLHMFAWVTGSIGDSTTAEFAEASATVATTTTDVLAMMLKVAGAIVGGTILLAMLPLLAGIVAGIVRHRKRWDWSTFGRRYDHREKDPLPFSDDGARCVNCHAEVDDGVRNVATENTVLFGFDVLEHSRIETVECDACADADWFEYAMRSGEHEDELFRSELDEDESDDDDTADPVDCPECGQECKNDHGLRVHVGRQHPELMEELEA